MNKIQDYIYIGDSYAGIRAGEDMDIPVVSLTKYKIDTINYDDNQYTHAPLIDGDGNSQKEFNKAVNSALRCIDNHGVVLVHCSAGISRSSAVVSTVIAEKEGVLFNEALNMVKSKKRSVNPDKELINLARGYLDEESPFSQYK